MRNRTSCQLATICGLLLLASVPGQASEIPFTEVVHTFNNAQSGTQTSDLRLRSLSQGGNVPSSSGVVSQQSPASTSAGGTSTTASGEAPSSLVASTSASQQEVAGNVQAIEQDDVTGTVCDCGEIRVPGGIPLWPLLGLGAIPFIPHHHDQPPCVDCTPPCVTCTSVPEPASLLLFGSGLAAIGAFLRRRSTRSRVEREEAVAAEV